MRLMLSATYISYLHCMHCPHNSARLACCSCLRTVAAIGRSSRRADALHVVAWKLYGVANHTRAHTALLRCVFDLSLCLTIFIDAYYSLNWRTGL